MPQSSEPNCKICNDFGVVHPLREDGSPDYANIKTCTCMIENVKREHAERLLRYCDLPEKTEAKTFEAFEARDELCREAKQVAYKMARGDDEVIFLTLLSKTGRGKSHLAIAICREWLKRSTPAKYAFVPELLDQIRDSYRQDELTGQTYSRLLEFLGTVPLLVLDDLGTEKKSEWACEKLQTIVDRRARSALPLVVTTNKSLDNLPNDDEGRIASRLQREIWCRVVLL